MFYPILISITNNINNQLFGFDQTYITYLWQLKSKLNMKMITKLVKMDKI